MGKEITVVADYQQQARKRLLSQCYNYFASGSDEQVTLHNNVHAFSSIYLHPRVLVDMTQISTKTSFLGIKTDIPFGISPFARQKLLHPKGQLITAKVAGKYNTSYTLSMLTTTKPSEILKVNPQGPKILQIYFLDDEEKMLDVLRMAERLKFHAIAITVDSKVFGKRRKDERSVFRPKVSLELFNQLGYDFVMRDDNIKQRSFVHQIRFNLTWKDIKWLRENTHLKIILKGIMSPQDVPMAHQCSVDALWVSNHGGRQLDTAPATILALPGIRQKVKELGSKMEVYIDGGIKKGSDIFKCLALQADFVFLGRGFLFSIIDGEEGVSKVFDVLTDELKQTMMACGANSVKAINLDYILKRPVAKL